MVMKKRSWVVIASLYRSRKITHEETKSAKKETGYTESFFALFVSSWREYFSRNLSWSFPFDHRNDLIRGCAETINDAARPMNLYLCAGRLTESEMRPQITLREVTAAASDFIHLSTPFSGRAVYPRADAGAIRLHPDRLYLEPVILRGLVATQELRQVVNAIHENIYVAIIVEIAEGAAAPGRFFENAGA